MSVGKEQTTGSGIQAKMPKDVLLQEAEKLSRHGVARLLLKNVGVQDEGREKGKGTVALRRHCNALPCCPVVAGDAMRARSGRDVTPLRAYAPAYPVPQHQRSRLAAAIAPRAS